MTETITEQVADFTAASEGRMPEEVGRAFAEEQQGLRERGVPAGAVSEGDAIPDLMLPNSEGKLVGIGELVADGPAVLVFYRGGWCPYCNIALRTYQRELLPELERRGIPLVAISPQAPDGSLSTREKAELQFTVLSDTGPDLARSLGILVEPSEAAIEAQRTLGLDLTTVNASGTAEIPMPTVLIVDSSRRVRFADVHSDYTTRTEVATILAALDGITAGAA